MSRLGGTLRPRAAGPGTRASAPQTRERPPAEEGPHGGGAGLLPAAGGIPGGRGRARLSQCGREEEEEPRSGVGVGGRSLAFRP